MKRIVQLNFKSLFLALGIFGIASLQGCKEEEAEPVYTTRVRVTESPIFGTRDQARISGANIYMYNTESDYINNTNIAHQAISDENGELIVLDKLEKYYWIRVTKGNLNNLRFKANFTKFGMGSQFVERGGSKPDFYDTFTLYAPLSSNPTKLQLNIYEDGNESSNATVQLYFSEQDYLNDVPAQNRIESDDFKKVYGDWGGFNTYLDVFKGITNNEGQILFDDLEAREYWIKVTKDGKSNASTVYKTNGALPDNADITNSLDIGIQ